MSYYPIKLDKVRNFKYGMKPISLVERYFKMPIAKVDMENLTMEDTATLIWAGLVHEDKDLTPDKVMDLIDDYSNLPDVMTCVSEALGVAFGEPEKGKNE